MVLSLLFHIVGLFLVFLLSVCPSRDKECEVLYFILAIHLGIISFQLLIDQLGAADFCLCHHFQLG